VSARVRAEALAAEAEYRTISVAAEASYQSSFLPQVCDNGKNAAVVVGCGAEVQLGEAGTDVGPRRSFLSRTGPGDGLVRTPLSHQAMYGLFSVGKSVPADHGFGND
jgi:hypothetical protein